MSTAAVERRVLTRGAFIKLNLFVCGVSTVASGLLGAWASVLYSYALRPGNMLGWIGLYVGGAGGLIAGVIWCRVMRAWVRAGVRMPVPTGIFLGFVLSETVTYVLHWCLIYASAEVDTFPVRIGVIFFGLPAGLIHGFVSSLVLLHWSQPVASELSLSPAVTAPAGMVRILRMFAPLAGRVPTSHLWYLFRRMWNERPHRFGPQVRINTFFPPYPSRAFDRFCAAVAARRRVPLSTYIAVTDACPFACPHCSYAGRPPGRLSREQLRDLIGGLKSLGTATVGFTGGEPLLRDDLEEVIAAARPELATIVFTTGHGLDQARARQLADAGVDCVTVGIESDCAAEHDRVRGRPGSFEEAEAAVRACRQAGIYTALSTVGTREKLADGTLERLHALGAAWGAGEFRLLAPVATGALRGCAAAMLSAEERSALAEFHVRHNRQGVGPAVASFAYLESDELFGCGAGYHHLFIDAAGEVCPCDLTPLSFGNVLDESLAAIWEQMGPYFARPRCGCLMGRLAGCMEGRTCLPVPRAESEALCGALGANGPLPEGYRRLLAKPQAPLPRADL